MKNKSFRLLVLIGIVAAMLPVVSSAQTTYGNLGIGVRRHVEHSEFDELPFGKRDHSLSVSYEFHESEAYWQLGLSYTPDLSRHEGEADAPKDAWTPEINLIAKDRFYHAGVGVASTYTDHDGGDWTSIYWQFLMGIRMELTRKISISGYGYYPFRRWSDLPEFSLSDIEYGVRLGFRF